LPEPQSSLIHMDEDPFDHSSLGSEIHHPGGSGEADTSDSPCTSQKSRGYCQWECIVNKKCLCPEDENLTSNNNLSTVRNYVNVSTSHSDLQTNKSVDQRIELGVVEATSGCSTSLLVEYGDASKLNADPTAQSNRDKENLDATEMSSGKANDFLTFT